MKKNPRKIVAVILAAGKGTRAGSILKQFIPVAGTPIIQYSLRVFLEHPSIDSVLVVIPRGKGREAKKALGIFGTNKKINLIEGGDTRYHSSLNALIALEKKGAPPDTVLIHDAVRPLISKEDVDSLLTSSNKHGAALLGIPAIETIGAGKNNFIHSVPKRDGLFYTFTPHAYSFNILRQAYKLHEQSGSQECPENSELVSSAGTKICLVETRKPNIKLTYPEDIDTLNSILSKQKGEV